MERSLPGVTEHREAGNDCGRCRLLQVESSIVTVLWLCLVYGTHYRNSIALLSTVGICTTGLGVCTVVEHDFVDR